MNDISSDDKVMISCIMQRDTIAPPTIIVNNLMFNEGLDVYVNMACEKIFDFTCENQNTEKDVIVNFLESTVSVTSVGLWLIKHIILSYVSEDRFQDYLKLLRSKEEQVYLMNNMINYLRSFKTKKLKNILKESTIKLSDDDNFRINEFIKAEIIARTKHNLLKQKYKKLRRKIKSQFFLLKVSIWAIMIRSNYKADQSV